MPRSSTFRRRPPAASVVLLSVLAVSLLTLAACGGSSGSAGSPSTAAGSRAVVTGGGPGPSYTVTGQPPITTEVYPKVMVIAEENEPASSVIGTSAAPYLTQLANTYGQATNMVANYPISCPSLAAYIIMTSGSRQGICDDAAPASHPLSSDNIFRQVAAAGKQWREYAESMTVSCQKYDGALGGYLVRHAPPVYYTSERNRCPSWHVPLGTTAAGHLHDDLASGLPDFSFVTPNACDDMHGAAPCPTDLVKLGDDWLAKWMPKIIASDDFQQAKLVVIITWDEGSPATNHIPTVIVAKTVHGVSSNAAFTHCSTLRTAEELLQLPYLGCAATAVSFRTGFHF